MGDPAPVVGVLAGSLQLRVLENQDRHIHLHVIPRYAGRRRVAEVDFADPDYPGHYQPGVEPRPLPDVIETIAAALTRE